MHRCLLVSVLCVGGCGEDAVNPPDVDTQTGNHPDPRVIAGGGIGDGAIDGVVNLYVIDDTDRTPVEGAEVRVGTVSGVTDATGLFVADGVTGPQDIVVKAPGHRKEVWLGANGANVTVDLDKDLDATPASHTFTGSITNFDSIQITATNHFKVAFITYSQTDKLGDPANEIATPNDGNLCVAASPGDPCNFTINTRTGKLALIATIVDVDTKGTPSGTDDTLAIIGYAVRQGIDTASAAAVQDLTMLADTDLQTVSIDLGSPPTALSTHAAVVGVELGDEGLLQIGTGSAASVKLPKLTALTGATGYQLVTIATDNATDPAQSITLGRHLPGPSLAAGSYLAPPSGISLSRTGGSWSSNAGATVQGVELKQGATKILNVTALDGRTTFEIPDNIALPSGPIDATVTAFGAAGFDVTDFALDEDIDKIDRLGGQDVTIN